MSPPGTPPVIEDVVVNGHITKGLYDTGLSFDATVSRALIRPEDLTGESVRIQGLNTSLPSTDHPIALINVSSRFVTGKIKAAVIDTPLYGLVIGRRYIFLGTPDCPEVATTIPTPAQRKAPPARINKDPQKAGKQSHDDGTSRRPQGIGRPLTARSGCGYVSCAASHIMSPVSPTTRTQPQPNLHRVRLGWKQGSSPTPRLRPQCIQHDDPEQGRIMWSGRRSMKPPSYISTRPGIAGSARSY